MGTPPVAAPALCRSDLTSRATAPRWLAAAVFLSFVAGFHLAGLYIRGVPAAAEFEADARAEYMVWTVLIAAIGGYALAALVASTVWLRGVTRLFRQFRPALASWWTLTVIAVGGTVFVSLFLAADTGSDIEQRLTDQTRPVVVAAAVAMVPGLMMFLALRAAAIDPTNWLESQRCRLRLLAELRAELRRLLTSLGGFLTLVVVATGMRRRALLALDPAPSIPREQVLLYGMVFAVLLGTFYVSAGAAIDRRATVLIDDLASGAAREGETTIDALRRHQELSNLVGPATSLQSFQAGVVVAGPLLTALVASATG